MIKIGGKDIILESEEQGRAFDAFDKYAVGFDRKNWGYCRSKDLGLGRLAHKFKKLGADEYLTVCEGYENEF